MDETDIAKAEERGIQVVENGLAQISRAMSAKPKDGNGDCMDCGEAIPVARLQAAPWARRCIHCQGLAERA